MNADGLDLEQLRQVAVAVAYRMVGSRTDAEDVAQETLLRVQAAAEHQELRSPEAFTTTVATRLAIDHLRSSRVRREAYVGPWLPEPVLDDPLQDPGRASELADSLSFAFLVLLESLGPVERAAFLLHDVFGFGYEDLAETLNRSNAACRQMVARARRRVSEGQSRNPVDPDRHRMVLDQFLSAARGGDIDRLTALLTEDAVLISDGGAGVKAARYPIVGRQRVARFLRKVVPTVVAARSHEVVTLNGQPGFLISDRRKIYLAGMVHVDGDRIRTVHWVLNPDKLRWLEGRREPPFPTGS